MAKAARKQSHRRAASHRPELKSIPGGRSNHGRTRGVESILSGKVTRPAKAAKKGREKKRPTEEIPRSLRKMSNVYAAGKAVEREMEFKVRYAEQKVKEHCLQRYAEIYATSGKRPPAIEYESDHSRFSFVQTVRTYLSFEKVEALKQIRIPIDDHTELRGVRVNYEAIRKHKLEKDLQKAFENMGVSEEVLDEIFVPDIQVKPSFYEILDNVVRESLRPGEKLEDKIYEVLNILSPANQVRNLEAVGLTAKQCFDLVMEAEISVPEDEELDIA